MLGQSCCTVAVNSLYAFVCDRPAVAHDFYWTKDEVTGELTLNDDGTVDEVCATTH